MLKSDKKAASDRIADIPVGLTAHPEAHYFHPRPGRAFELLGATVPLAVT
jgi:hypothetical protein